MYKTEKDIADLVSRFENCTVARDEWKHAEHLVVALYYATRHDLETATDKIRTGIFRLLGAFGVDLTKEMPYHETLTVFWMRTIYDFAIMKNGASLPEMAAELLRDFDKDHPLLFYSRERLFSDEARVRFLECDLTLPADYNDLGGIL